MKINFIEKTIQITKTEMEKASHYDSNEYRSLLAITKDLPDYKIIIKSTPKRRSTYTSPTYEYMESYLASSENASANLEEFFHLRRAGANYNQIKKWFMNKCTEAFALAA